jgi:hypothetical protein
MNEVKFTPWTAERDDSGGEIGLWSVADAVGNVVFFGMERDEALLFASGPNMLAALESAVALSDKKLNPEIGRTGECQRVYDQCAAAIARARGDQS